VVIKIFAGAGEGKTTISEWLQTELSKLGFIVENGDPDPLPPVPLEERLRTMADPMDPLKIEIKTIPFKAEGLPAFARRHRGQ
jgi:hypothetical protein